MSVLLFGYPKNVCGEGGDEGIVKWDQDKKKLYFDHIFPKLGWNDMLRFRRVCKDAKALADEYIKKHGLCPEISVHEESVDKEKSMTKLLQLGFPITRIHLVNLSAAKMFENERKSFEKFIAQYGSKVTHVRAIYMYNYPMGMEKSFYEGLSKLECLEVEKLGGYALSQAESIRMARLVEHASFPRTFKNLKRVSIGVAPEIVTMNAIIMSRAVMDFCTKLEYASDAYSSFIETGGISLSHETLGLVFKMIQEAIESGSNQKLKFYDFISFNKDGAVLNKCVSFKNAPDFLTLANVCASKSVKLLNVNAAWIQNWEQAPRQVHRSDHNILGNTIVSMVNVHGFVASLEMANLEKLSIPATSQSCLFPGVWKRDRRPWPALKELDVSVDSKLLYTMVVGYNAQAGKATCLDAETTCSLLEFLFVGIQQPALVQVRLKVEDGVGLDEPSIKAISSVGKCCPNLKILTLTNCPITNGTLAKMWREMRNLEELCLDGCKKIGDLAFLGTDTTDPVSTQLKNLRRVSLLGLDKMANITDRLFKDMLSQMSITHLTLSSDKPLSKVTPDGIRALKNGPFANFIQKFPFQGWSLAKQTQEDFRNIGKEFRSSQML